jgi:hypothetical protein
LSIFVQSGYVSVRDTISGKRRDPSLQSLLLALPEFFTILFVDTFLRTRGGGHLKRGPFYNMQTKVLGKKILKRATLSVFKRGGRRAEIPEKGHPWDKRVKKRKPFLYGESVIYQLTEPECFAVLFQDTSLKDPRDTPIKFRTLYYF